MTLALALDTSTPVLSAALVAFEGTRTRILGTRSAGPPAITSTLVPSVFDELLSAGGKTLADVDLFVAGLGPGLFTGMRVAVSSMKAIAYARQKPLIGAGSLEAMALARVRAPGEAIDPTALLDSDLLCPVLDARKGEVYWAIYAVRNGQLEEIESPRASPPAVLAERLSREKTAQLFGTGSIPMKTVLSMNPGAGEIAALAHLRSPDPQFDLMAVLNLEPTYLRPPEAEVARQKRASGTSSPGP